VFAAFGPDESMQIYGRGLRRRIPPMLDGDPRRIRMVYSLLFSLPGTPVLFYGEEIGMGEELAAEGRSAVRTTMQWTAGRNGGFSSARRARLAAATVSDGFGPEHVNVESQRRDPESLLSFVSLLVRRYRESPELGWGDLEILDQPHRAVLAHRLTHDDTSTVAIHNLGPDACQVPLRLRDEPEGTVLVDQLCDGTTELDAKGRAEVDLDGYGYRWLRLVRPADRRLT
jgi:glycosidase